MKYLSLILVFVALLAFAEDEHEADEHKHAEGEKHEEASNGVGPDKGIIEKNEDDGFKFSQEAIKTIGYKTINYQTEIFEIPSKALVQVKDDKSIYRLRNGWLKRVDIQIIKKNTDSILLKATDLKSGDQIVVTEVGYLRIAEVFSEEGAEHSH